MIQNNDASTTTATSDYLIGNHIDGYATPNINLVYSESFESGSIPYATNSNSHNSNYNDNHYIEWSASGNGQWNIANISDTESYDGSEHVATIGGHGKFAMESTLMLTIGDNNNNYSYNNNNAAHGSSTTTTHINVAHLQEMMEQGGYLTFAINAAVSFPLDSLVFRLNGNILGYWLSNTDGWEVITAHLPPGDVNGDGIWDYTEHELKWIYSYYGGEDEDSMERGEDVVMLDAISVEATTGDLTVSDEMMQQLSQEEENSSHHVVPALDLHHPSGDGSWQVVEDGGNAHDGSHVFRASTRDVIRSIPANSQGITTYQGLAVMSFTIITGQWGGVVHFAHLSNVNTPIDVLEVAVNGEPVVAATGGTGTANSNWEFQMLELEAGKHVVTFSHISNPAGLPMEDLEDMGQPGESKIDGLRYVDHIDPALLTPVPTTAPTTAAPTVFSIPPQNYCGTNLDSIQDTCYTVDAPPTCNDNDGPCPLGTFCYGNVECIIPMEAYSDWMGGGDTPEPTAAPSSNAIPPQNYCGTNLASIKAQCASRSVPTCNDDDGPCPTGTFCWGNIHCPVPAPEPTASPMGTPPQNYCGTSLASIKAMCATGALPTCNEGDAPCRSGTYCWGNVECDPIETEGPTASPSEVTVQSFLDSFFGTSANTGGGDNTASAAEEEEEEEEDEMVELQDNAPSAEQQDGVCPEGTSPAQGLSGCCVPDPSFLGDGACDSYPPYNTPECGYDLGDCCRESCNPDTPFKCAAKEGDAYGPFGYYCLDPRYSAIDEEACNAENREWVGDGGCDPDYNTQECGWDGGDCCRETCDVNFSYYECGRDAQPFDCKNPDIIYRAGYQP